MMNRPNRSQSGVSLTGLIILVVIVGAIAVVGMKVVPTVIEYQAIKKAVVNAKSSGTNEREIRYAFDKNAEVGYIETLKGKDLDITRVGNDLEVSFAYEKKIPLVGPASLVIDYEGSTAKTPTRKNSNMKDI